MDKRYMYALHANTNSYSYYCLKYGLVVKPGWKELIGGTC